MGFARRPHGLLLLLLASNASAQKPAAKPVSYATDVAPFLRTYCAPCHYGTQRAGGLSLSTYDALMRGGQHGPSIVPGKASDSRLVLMIEGKAQPVMPPIPSGKPLDTKPLRAWIDAGAKEAEGERRASAPTPSRAGGSKMRDRRIDAVAFAPSGRILAAAGNGEVSLIDGAAGRVVTVLRGLPGPVTGVAFSPDGKRLAAAASVPGEKGEVWVWNVSFVKPQGLWAVKQAPAKLSGPTDGIYGLAFSPDGRRLAAASYDHNLYVWQSGSAKPAVLKDHTDAVYSVAFSRDGRLIASAAGDRTVKVWSAETGKRLYTLSESTAELYAVAFSPDGLHLASGGVDKTLRIYRVSPTGGKLERSALAHDAAILRIAYDRAGASLYTSGEDRAVKRWDAATLAEKRVYPRQPDWPQGIALSADGALLAVGRQDGSLAIYDAATGRLLREPLRGAAAAHVEPPRSSSIPGRRLGDNKQRRPRDRGPVTLQTASLGSVAPTGVVRGSKVRLTLAGGRISDATAVLFDDAAIAGKIVSPADPNKGLLRVDTEIGAAARIGIHRVFLQSPHGTTGSAAFAVGGWPEIAQREPNDTPAAAQPIQPPCTVVGALDQPGDVDCYAVDARAGQELVFEVVAQPIRSRLQPVLTVFDARGAVLAESQMRPGRPDVLVGCRIPVDGRYVVRLHDYEGAGGGDVYYRLNVGEFPVVTDVFPLGVRRGAKSIVQVHGFNLGATTVVVDSPPDNATDLQMETPKGPLLYPVRLAVGEDAEAAQAAGNVSLAAAQRLAVPSTINGRLSGVGTGPLSHYYRFAAKKGQRLALEVLARRAGSKLDSEIEVLDPAGHPIERAVLRAVGRTEMVLNDRDSATNALRLQAWDDFHLDDLLMVGREVIKISLLPRGPDEDVFFRTYRGQRLAYLDTTPEFHSLGSPVYKVEVHPAGSRFSRNGYPLTHLYYRNDDGGPLYGKDSHLDFTAPADGDYIVRLSDTRGLQGDEFPYRLMIHEPRPDYRLSMTPEHPNIPKGGSAVVDVSCDRYDGFDGPVDIWLEGLPAGFSATRTTIEAGETSAQLLISASPDAVTPPVPQARTGAGGSVKLRLAPEARIAGQRVLHAVVPEPMLLTVLPTPDVRVATDLHEVVIHPGEELQVEARVERQNGFGNRVPLEVKNLPFGVRVPDIGLNGVLITEDEDSRRFTLHCEPWVKPQTRMIYVVANVEGGTPNGAPPILLRVEPAAKRGATALR